MTHDPQVQPRKAELIAEADVVLGAICNLAGSDVAHPLTDPAILACAVTSGILDAPQLKNNPFALGRAATRIDVRGACVTTDPASGAVLAERERLAVLFQGRNT